MGRRGFEPLKHNATGLQPVPFDHSGTCPRIQLSVSCADRSGSEHPDHATRKGASAWAEWRASGGNRTHNPPLTRRELYR